jgi:hypothetical protein
MNTVMAVLLIQCAVLPDAETQPSSVILRQLRHKAFLFCSLAPITDKHPRAPVESILPEQEFTMISKRRACTEEG